MVQNVPIIIRICRTEGGCANAFSAAATAADNDDDLDDDGGGGSDAGCGDDNNILTIMKTVLEVTTITNVRQLQSRYHAYIYIYYH